MKPTEPSPELLRELLRERASVQPSEAAVQRIYRGAVARSNTLQKQSFFRKFWSQSLEENVSPDSISSPRFILAMAALFVVSAGLAVFTRLMVRESRPQSPTAPIIAGQPNAALKDTTPVGFPSTKTPNADSAQSAPDRD